MLNCIVIPRNFTKFYNILTYNCEKIYTKRQKSVIIIKIYIFNMQRRIIMEVFTLIARKKNVALVFVSYLLVALAAISLLTICIGFAPGILFAVVFGLIAYLMIMAQNTEFEYSYFDGELRFAKIKNKSRRKRLGIYSMESVAAIAPAGDRSVYNYENGNELKEIDYTSGQNDVPYYDIIIKSPDENVLIKAELDDKFLTEVEKKYRSKVKRREE